jgi:hypothetical protein
MRLRPHPPHRPPIPGGAMASTLCPSLTARTKGFHPAPAEISRIRVRLPEGNRRSSCMVTGVSAPRWHAALSGTCVRQAGRRMLTRGLPRLALSRTPPVTRWSRHRLENRYRRSLVQPKPRRRPAIPPHEPCSREKASDSRAPPYGLLAQTACGAPPVARRLRRPRRTLRHPLAWTAQRRSARLGNRIARTIRSPGAEGRLTRLSAKSDEIGCTRGAFHRSAAFVHDTGLAPGAASSSDARLRRHPTRPELALANPPGQGVLHSLSPACGEHTMPFSILHLTAGLDGPTTVRNASSAA